MKNAKLILVLSTGLLGASSAFAASTSHSEAARVSCSQEMRHQTVWQAGPRSQTMARVEKQPVTVCDGKVVKTVPQLAKQ